MRRSGCQAKRRPTPIAIGALLLASCLWLATFGSATALADAGCDNSSVSALNEYCPTTPSATGPHASAGNSPSLGSTVSPTVASQITHADGGRYKSLASLPAAAKRAHAKPAPGARPTPTTTTKVKDAAAVPAWGFVLIIACAIAMLVVVLNRRRRA